MTEQQKLEETLNMLANRVSDLKAENDIFNKENSEIEKYLLDNKTTKETLSGEIQVLETKKEALQGEVDNLVLQKETLIMELSEILSDINFKKKELIDSELATKQELEKLNKRELDITKKEDDLTKRESLVVTNETSLRNYGDELNSKESLLEYRENLLVVRNKIGGNPAKNN